MKNQCKKKHPKQYPKLKASGGYPLKDEVLSPKPPKRVELQSIRDPEENLKDLPNHCNVCAKNQDFGASKSSFIVF
ncbi:MAG: hypothetical protein KKC46_02845 [Proteobacteria bacterium]|nr:hypothetical protein [Pseudomonadota bacterium]